MTTPTAAHSAVARYPLYGAGFVTAFGAHSIAASLGGLTGYTAGPVLGGVLIWAGGYDLLFAVLGGAAAVVALWAAWSVPGLPPLPRTRQTVVDLLRRLGSRSFVLPTAALAGSTAVLAVGVGFLPVSGADEGLGPLATGAIVSLLALAASLVQPQAGRARDAGNLPDGVGIPIGLGVAALGLAATLIPGPTGLVAAALLIGAGVGLVTPLGFAHLAQHSPKDRLGQTMGSAEVGRELGDAGGPLLVGAIAAAAGLTAGLAGLGVVLVVVALAALRLR